MKNLKEVLCLINPELVIPLLENVIDTQKQNLKTSENAGNDSGCLSIHHQIADVRILKLLITASKDIDVDIDRCLSVMNFNSIKESIFEGIQMERANLQAYECLGDEANCRESKNRIRDGRILEQAIHMDLFFGSVR